MVGGYSAVKERALQLLDLSMPRDFRAGSATGISGAHDSGLVEELIGNTISARTKDTKEHQNATPATIEIKPIRGLLLYGCVSIFAVPPNLQDSLFFQFDLVIMR